MRSLSEAATLVPEQIFLPAVRIRVYDTVLYEAIGGVEAARADLEMALQQLEMRMRAQLGRRLDCPVT